MKSTTNFLKELDEMPMTKFVRKYGYLTFSEIYELLEQQADLLGKALEAVKESRNMLLKEGTYDQLRLHHDKLSSLILDLEVALKELR